MSIETNSRDKLQILHIVFIVLLAIIFLGFIYGTSKQVSNNSKTTISTSEQQDQNFGFKDCQNGVYYVYASSPEHFAEKLSPFLANHKELEVVAVTCAYDQNYVVVFKKKAEITPSESDPSLEKPKEAEH